MYGETGDFVLSLLFAHTEQTQTNHTLCVRMWGLGVETGTRSCKLSGCTLCIINLRSQSSLHIPNHTMSYAFCIIMHMCCVWNWGFSQVLRFIHSAICHLYVRCTHMYESEDVNPVLRFLYKGMFNSSVYQKLAIQSAIYCPRSLSHLPAVFPFCVIIF